jgi:hypothetical protein
MVDGVDFDFKEKKLVLSTLETTEKLGGKKATTLSDRSIEWDVGEEVRLPTTDRYSSALTFDYGGDSVTIGPLGQKVEAFATLWLAELVDDEPKEVRLPVIVSKSPALRHNYLNDQTEKTHEYQVVGWLTTTVILDSGLDADFEKHVQFTSSLPSVPTDSLSLSLRVAETQTARHEFEQWDRVEGQAKQATANSHAADDGVIDKQEQREIATAHKKALESRHRGKMQFRAIRSYVWAKDGAKDRVSSLKDKLTGHSKKEETVATEG